MDLAALDNILKQTISAIEKGKEQIYDIAESARQEWARVKKELEQVKKETLETIEEVDRLEHQERAARRRLMEVSKNFNRYSEEDMQTAYEQARQLQIQLGHMREREQQLRRRRDQLEFSLRRLEETVKKAEDLVSQVGVALRFLTEDLQGLTSKLEEMQQRQSLGIRVIKAQEEERKRVAREIHDGPAQSMANLVMRAEICEKLLEVEPGVVKHELSELKSMVKASLQDVRKIIYDLRPMALDDLGIVPTLKRYMAEFEEKHGLDVDFSVTGQEQRFSNALEVALFRIVQEALNNVYKHAQARQVSVKLELMPEKVNLVVIDDGKGFHLDKVMAESDKDTYGLMGMRERVELLDGIIRINTSPGRGTKIAVQIPLNV
ncbi:histidine kinase [Clostridiales bacterium PH28_bin88]|nr:histidine kinase [Clostridiales bacterium PH28_bin88]